MSNIHSAFYFSLKSGMEKFIGLLSNNLTIVNYNFGENSDEFFMVLQYTHTKSDKIEIKFSSNFVFVLPSFPFYYKPYLELKVWNTTKESMNIARKLVLEKRVKLKELQEDSYTRENTSNESYTVTLNENRNSRNSKYVCETLSHLIPILEKL